MPSIVANHKAISLQHQGPMALTRTHNEPYATLMSELTQALKVQKRVVTALIFREILAQYGATKIGYLWALLLPISQTFILAVIFWSVGRGDMFGSDFGSIVLFIATGFLSLNLFVNISNQIMQSNSANRALFGYPLVLPFDAMISRLILTFVTTILSFMTTLLIIFQVGLWSPEIDSILRVTGAIVVISLIGFGVGMVNSFIILILPSYQNIYSIITRPLMFMSGVFYLASDQLIPKPILDILYYNPILHCTEWLRSGFYKNWESKFTDFNYVIPFLVISLFIGLLTQRLSQKKARE